MNGSKLRARDRGPHDRALDKGPLGGWIACGHRRRHPPRHLGNRGAAHGLMNQQRGCTDEDDDSDDEAMDGSQNRVVPCDGPSTYGSHVTCRGYLCCFGDRLLIAHQPGMRLEIFEDHSEEKRTSAPLMK